MMKKVTDIETYRRHKIENQLVDIWQRRFGERYRIEEGLGGVSDRTLLFLAEQSDPSDQAYFEMICSVLEPGGPAVFSRLGREQQCRVLDIQFYLADRIRFEMMRRLGWLRGYEGDSATIPAIILEFEDFQYRDYENPPELAPSHADDAVYRQLIPREKGVFVRRLYPDALTVFQQRRH
jgi:hypothetical protein